MAPQRISIKLFFKSEAVPGPEAQIAAFHRWIRDKKLGGLLIDVADYAHVPDGPGIMIIGHEADYNIDHGPGGVGLLVTRKRIESGDLASAVDQVARLAAVAAAALESEGFSPSIEVNTGRLRVTLLDRLRYPADGSNIQPVADEVAKAVAESFGVDASAEPVAHDGRGPAAFDLTLVDPPSVAQLQERLGAATP